MLMENRPASRTRLHIFVCLPAQNSTSGGSIETEVKEFAVKA
jgi:hypothetical protein